MKGLNLGVGDGEDLDVTPGRAEEHSRGHAVGSEPGRDRGVRHQVVLPRVEGEGAPESRGAKEESEPNCLGVRPEDLVLIG